MILSLNSSKPFEIPSFSDPKIMHAGMLRFTEYISSSPFSEHENIFNPLSFNLLTSSTNLFDLQIGI